MLIQRRTRASLMVCVRTGLDSEGDGRVVLNGRRGIRTSSHDFHAISSDELSEAAGPEPW